MILVKSLIVIFLMLIFARFYKTFLNFLGKLFDAREGFEAEEPEAEKASEEVIEVEEEIEEEESYNINQKVQLVDETKMIADIQEQFNDLFKLKEEALKINDTMK